MRKRKICFVITSEIHYARNKLIIDELRKRKDVRFQVVVAAGALLDVYGDVIPLLEKDGIRYDAKVVMTLQGGSCVAMAKTTGLGIIEFSSVFENLRPDLVIIRGDRYEMLSAAIAAAYQNICLAHIEGGDVSGNIDESVRHAITKLSHLHFVTNELSHQRVLRMGERPETVFNVGSPEIELISKKKVSFDAELINRLGVGGMIDFKKPYLVVMYHPVTTEIEANEVNVKEVIEAIDALNIPTIWFWPNPDAGTDEVAGALRRYREFKKPNFVRFLKYQPNDIFMGILYNSSCLVGNSSTGIKECSYWGIPVVNIGTRQKGRLRGPNVLDVGYKRGSIINAIRAQYNHGRYDSSDVYYKKETSLRIAEMLNFIELTPQKQFYDDSLTVSYGTNLPRKTNFRSRHSARRIEKRSAKKY